MWVIHSWPWYWFVWPWWGGRIYRIVTGVTSHVGVPSTYLVCFSVKAIMSFVHGVHRCMPMGMIRVSGILQTPKLSNLWADSWELPWSVDVQHHSHFSIRATWACSQAWLVLLKPCEWQNSAMTRRIYCKSSSLELSWSEDVQHHDHLPTGATWVCPWAS